MARRDVDLVIKARDEAAKVVDSITAAINQFTDSQKELDSRSEKTETSLTALGAAIGKLDKELKGLSAGDAISTELARAETALSRLDDRFDNTTKEVAGYERQLRQAETATTRFTSKLDGAAAAQDRQRSALARAKTDQRELTKAYEQAASAQAKLERRQAKLPGLIDKASVAADKAATRFNNLSDQVLGTVNPTRALQNQLETSQQSMTRTATRLTSLREEYGQIGSKIRAAGSAFAIFSGQAERATTNVAQQEAIFQKIGQNLSELKVKTGAASTEQARLSREFDKANTSLARQGQEIDKARANYEQLAASSGEAGAALARLANAGLQELEAEWKAQRRAVLEAKREYAELAAETTRVGSAFSKLRKPTAEQTAEFDQLRAASARLKADLVTQRATYEQLGTALRGTSGDIESVRATQQRFAAIQDQLAQKLKASATAADKQRAAIDKLNGTTTRAVSNGTRQVGVQTQLATANSRAASSTSRLAAAYREFYGTSRQSLSLLQRIRGEVLSLVAAYGGLFAGIEVLKGTVDATQSLEAAQSRLGVAFDGDNDRVATELDFLRRTANRLGVDIGTLATEYSKFNIATKNTSLEGAAARKIFVQVAEAARVNRSSTAELSGVFVALTQIVSKGAVQMEELRQQLGDRLPGALKIMADGLGVTTAELIKMLEQGQVTEAALIPFGDELQKRFGPGLAEALASTNVAIGRLGAAAFEALVKFGQSGFIDSFQNFVNDLTSTLRSADFEAFASRASSALGGIVDILSFMARNFQLVFAAAAGFIGLKLTPFVIAIAGGLKAAGVAAVAAAGGLSAAGTAATVATGRFGIAAAAASGLTVALRTLLSTTGIGLAVTAIAAGVALWATEADRATEALNEHRTLVDQVKNAYDQAGGSVVAWRESIESVTAQTAVRNLREIQEAAQNASDELVRVFARDGETGFARFSGIGSLLTGASQDFNKEIEGVIKSFREGQISAEELQDQVDEINQKFGEGSKANARYADALDEAIIKIVKLAEAEREAQAVVDAKTGSVEKAAEAAKELGIANEEAADALDPEKTAKFSSSMATLKGVIDSTTKSTTFLEQAMKIEGAFEEAIANAQTLEERVNAAINASEALAGASQKFVDTNFSGFTDGTEASAALIRQFEGFRATPYFDVNAQRVGFGSDTITLADGTIQKVVKGMRVSVEDANRDLLRRIGTEFLPKARNATGAERFDSFTPQQQAALTSIAYNYGELPERIIEAVQTGSNQQIANAIRGLAGDNEGVNRNRRFQEAALFTSAPAVETQVREAERLAELDRERAASTSETIQNNAFEIDQQERILAGKERQAAIEEAIRNAKAENPNITASEIAQIEAQVGKLFDLEQKEKNRLTTKEKAQKAEEEVNRLISTQAELREQLQIAEDSGNSGKAEELRAEINALNEEILKAISNTQEMWRAVGGAEADAAITKLDTAAARAARFGLEGQNTYLQWDRVADLFVTGVATAFEAFTKSVAEGQSIGESARVAFLQFAADFLAQIAQMIIQQAIFNALKSSFGGTGFGNLIGLGTAHTGGIVGSKRVGSANSTRKVNPAAFIGATRYHEGGFAGLRPGEVPTILKEGEEVLTGDDPRHALNGAAKGLMQKSPMNLRIVNALSSEKLVEEGIKSRKGEEALLNTIRGNSEEIRSMLGV